MGILKGLLYAGLLSLLGLIVAVAVATAYLPSYGDLTKRADLGQMIRVRAANGQVLVSMGPSFGNWLPYDRIPPEMRAAMISTEDRRFRSHIGHARIIISCTHRMTHCFILLLYWHLALIIFTATLAVIQ